MDRFPFSRSGDPMYSHIAFHSPNQFPRDISRFPQHSHDIVELILFKNGDAFYDVEGRSYPLYPNTLVITKPAAIHQIRLVGDSTYERYDILFNFKKHMPEQYPLLEKMPDVMQLEDDHPIVQIFRRMDFYYQHLPKEEYSQVLELLIREVFYNLVISARAEDASEALPENPLIRNAIIYVQEHIATLSDINEICAELFISKSHLHHLFMEQMNITPKKYILSKRMMLAKTLLRGGESPTNVFSKCGFLNYTTFFRCYKNFFGYCPSEELEKGSHRDFYS